MALTDLTPALESFDLMPDRAAELLALADAMDAAVHAPPRALYGFIRNGKATAENIAELLRDVALDSAAQAHYTQQVRRARKELDEALADALRPTVSQLAAKVLPAFAQHVAALEALADIDPDTDPADLLRSDAKTIKRWNEHHDHAAELDRLAAIRHDLAACGYGPRSPEVVHVIADAEDLADLERAQALYTEANGWHRLAHAGYRLSMNTDTDAAALLAKCHAATEDAERKAQATQSPATRRARRDADRWATVGR